MPDTPKRLREPIDPRQKLLDFVQDWSKDHWPACVADGEQQDQQLKLQSEVWLLQQVQRWEVDLSSFRNHKLKVRPGCPELLSVCFEGHQCAGRLWWIGITCRYNSSVAELFFVACAQSWPEVDWLSTQILNTREQNKTRDLFLFPAAIGRPHSQAMAEHMEFWGGS